MHGRRKLLRPVSVQCQNQRCSSHVQKSASRNGGGLKRARTVNGGKSVSRMICYYMIPISHDPAVARTSPGFVPVAALQLPLYGPAKLEASGFPVALHAVITQIRVTRSSVRNRQLERRRALTGWHFGKSALARGSGSLGDGDSPATGRGRLGLDGGREARTGSRRQPGPRARHSMSVRGCWTAPGVALRLRKGG